MSEQTLDARLDAAVREGRIAQASRAHWATVCASDATAITVVENLPAFLPVVEPSPPAWPSI